VMARVYLDSPPVRLLSAAIPLLAARGSARAASKP
jgi:hypothetical protein